VSGFNLTLTDGNDNWPGSGVNNNNNDSILGLGGNDTIFGGNGSDTLDGGAGSDRQAWFSCEARLSCAVLSGSASGGRAKLPFHQMSYWPRLQGDAQCLA
jgi:hypothetical protein